MQLRDQGGFTLVEMLLSFAIFGTMLLIMTVVLLQLFHIYEAGHQIRDTQEAARYVSQQITDDTHDSLVIGTGTQNGQGSICLYKTIQQQNNNLTGVEYYIGPYSGSNPGLTIRRSDISTLYSSTTPPGCPTPPNDSTNVPMTSSSVLVKYMSALSAPSNNPRLVSVKASFESAYAQQAGADITVGTDQNGFDQCIGGSNDQYCSITNIEFAAISHSDVNQ